MVGSDNLYTLGRLINDTIEFYKNNNLLLCAYLERKNKSDYEDTHLYLILDDKNLTFRDLSNNLDIIKELESNTNIYYKKIYNWDRSLHIITIDKLSFHIHLVKHIYNFEHLNILYNPNNLEVKEDSNNNTNLIFSIKDFINDLNYCYREITINDNYLGLYYLNKVYNDLIYFLCNFYLDYNVSKDDIHVNFDIALKKMDKSKVNKLNQIIKLMNIDTINDSVKLIIWFFDEYVINLPIMVMQAIDIDLYIFIKEIILK